jgi:hypothetical protein
MEYQWQERQILALLDKFILPNEDELYIPKIDPTLVYVPRSKSKYS